MDASIARTLTSDSSDAVEIYREEMDVYRFGSDAHNRTGSHAHALGAVTDWIAAAVSPLTIGIAVPIGPARGGRKR
jgi:hypothetical protein